MPTVPPGSDDVVMTSAGAVMAIESAAVIDADALSVTLTVKLLDPAAVGLPEIVPLPASVRPAGIDPLASVHV